MVDVLGAAPRAATFAHLLSILGVAIDDKRIAKKLVLGQVDRPPTTGRAQSHADLEQIRAVRAGIPARYQAIVDLGSDCGLGQGEDLRAGRRTHPPGPVPGQ